MTMWLKQSTAITVKFGPFVDATDGVTPETGLTISQADIRLSKNGGDSAQTNNAAGATHDENGYYDVPLNTTDTNTLGTLRVFVNESGALPVWQDFMVVPANVWDSMFGADRLQVDMLEISSDSAAADNLEAYTDGTTPMPVNAMQISGDATAADNMEADYDGTGYNKANSTIGTVAALTANNDKTGYGLANGAITAAVIATDAIDADALATDAVNEILDALSVRRNTAQAGAAGTITLDASASATDDLYNGLLIQIVSGTGAGQARVITDYVGSTKVASIEPNWTTNPDATSVFRVLAFAYVPGLAVTARAQVNTEADTALTDYDPPTRTELTSDTNSIITEVNANETKIDTIDGIVDAILVDTAEIGAAGAGLTAVPWNAAWDAEVESEATDALNAYDPPTRAELTSDIDSLPTAAENADAVWDEATSGHVAAGSFGQAAQVIRTGTAQAGAAGTITLDSGASASDDFYNNTILQIVGGTGVGQSRIISDYVGSTKVATVNGNWVTNPDATSVFVVRAFGAIPGASAPTAGEVADAVWEEAIADHSGTTGSTAEALNAAGAAGDPWTTALPGAYGAGSAGKIIGDNINATISSRASQTSVDTVDGIVDSIVADTNELQTDWANGGRLDNILDARASQTSVDTIDGIVDAILADTDSLDTTKVTTARANNLDNLDATVSSRSTVTTAQVNTEVDTALADARLDELLAADSDIDGAAPPAVGSVVHELLSKTAGSFTYDQTTDSLEAIRDKAGDIETDTQDLQTTLAGLNDVSTAEVQAAAAAALTAYDPPTRAELTTDTNSIITEVNANEAKIDAIDNVVDQILADTGTDGVVLTAAAVDAILDEVVEGSLTMRQLLRIVLSGLAGKSAGSGTATVTFRDVADAKARITATVSSGNRTAVTLDGS